MSSEERAAARKEVDVLSSGRLVHPNIIRYYGHYEHQGRINIVMEYADQGDLAQVIQATKTKGLRIPVKHVRHWFVQIVSALEFVHRKRILHRDLKAQNIFLQGKNPTCIALHAEDRDSLSYALSDHICQSLSFHC